MRRPLTSLRKIGLEFERAAKQYRWLLRYAHSKRVKLEWLNKSTPELERSTQLVTGDLRQPKRCLLDLRRIANDGEQGRRFHALVRMLQRGGYELSLVPRLQFLQTGHRLFKANALSSIRPFCENDLPSDFQPFDICLSDGRGNHKHAHRTIQVMTGSRRSLQDRDLAMPYSMFPDIWDHHEDARFPKYRNQKRVWRWFFGGHCSRESYQRIKKYSRMRPVDRHRVVQEVTSHFERSTLEIRSDEQLESALRTGHDSFVMIDNAAYRTQASRWLGLLASSDFFLAAPGCDYPLSHNAIEAIAVGTIPVLEYDSLFTPALRDGVNCITYRGVDGLRQAAKRVQSATPHQIAKLRAGVIEYYESHLSPNAFCDQLENRSNERLHLFSYLTPATKRAA